MDNSFPGPTKENIVSSTRLRLGQEEGDGASGLLPAPGALSLSAYYFDWLDTGSSTPPLTGVAANAPPPPEIAPPSPVFGLPPSRFASPCPDSPVSAAWTRPTSAHRQQKGVR